MIQVGVAGYGYWGPNLVRNFVEIPGTQVRTVCDPRPERLAQVQARYPGVRAMSDYQELISDPEIDAIVLATPVSTHYELARQALQSGRHVLVEKPLASTPAEAARLIDLAAGRGLVLMVDHTFVYTGAVRKVEELVTGGDLGDIYYYDSVRVNLGLFQHDCNVIWDLAVHDLSIMDYVLPSPPRAVSATGMSHIAGEPENVAYMTLFFDNNLIGHIHVNWLTPVKVRRTLVGGSRRMIVYDDLEPSEKIKVYDKGITVNEHDSAESVYQMLISYRVGDMWAPQLDMTEALQVEALHFARCIEQDERPITDGQAGLRVVQLMQAATVSMKGRGRLVYVDGMATAEGSHGQNQQQ